MPSLVGFCRKCSRPERLAALLVIAAFCAIYLPDVGHGFVKDDVEWIAHSRIDRWADASVLTGAPGGFFRPIVSLSFAIDRRFCRLAPFCYGLTNLVLALACGLAVVLLARTLRLSTGASVLAGALWLFNWHGINMAVLWISGRSALLLTLFSVLAAAAFAWRHAWLALAMVAAAMLSKEEAVLLPLVLAAWFVAEQRQDTPRAGSFLRLFLVGAAVVESLYFLVRLGSGAYTPFTAPPYYRFAFSLLRLARNLPEYVDRTTAFSLVSLLAFALLARFNVLTLCRLERRLLAFVVCWWTGTLALTVFLPVRSSLYACLPSVAAAIGVAALINRAWPSLTAATARRCIAAAAAAALLLWPVYHLRNQRFVREADLSAQTIATLRQVSASHSPGLVVMLRDDRGARPSLQDCFGTLIQDAANLLVTPPPRVWIEPPPADAALAGLSRPSSFDVELRLDRGMVRRAR